MSFEYSECVRAERTDDGSDESRGCNIPSLLTWYNAVEVVTTLLLFQVP